MSNQYKKLTDNDIMPFGKHKGKKMIDVPASWFIYMLDEMNIGPGSVRDYILENIEVLRLEVGKSKEEGIKNLPKENVIKKPTIAVDYFGAEVSTSVPPPIKSSEPVKEVKYEEEIVGSTTVDKVIYDIVEVLTRADPTTVEQYANELLSYRVKYVGDSNFNVIKTKTRLNPNVDYNKYPDHDAPF